MFVVNVNNVELTNRIRFLAAGVKRIYAGTAESYVKEGFECIAIGLGNEKLTLSSIKEEVLRASCIPRFIKKVMRCPQCKRWKLTNRVFCEECSKNLTVNDDWSQCVLSDCRCNCDGNSEKWMTLTAERRREATCIHFSKQPTGDYVLFIPPEAIIADYMNMGYTKEMVGLKEDQIKELAKDADACGFHHILLTENSKRIYEAVGFSEAAEAVEDHLSHYQKHDSLDVLSRVVDEAIQSDYFKPSSCRSESTQPVDSSLNAPDSGQSQRPHLDSPDSNSVEEQSLGIPFFQLADDPLFNDETNGTNVVYLRDMKNYNNNVLHSIWEPLSYRCDLMKCMCFYC